VKCPICGGEQKKIEEKSFVKGFEILAEFYRCEACGEELMTEGQFRKGMDKIIKLSKMLPVVISIPSVEQCKKTERYLYKIVKDEVE
jgi:hypothetical protein